MNRFIQFNKVYLSTCFSKNAKIIGWEVLLPISAGPSQGEPQPTNLGWWDNKDGYFSQHTDTTFLLFNLASHTTIYQPAALKKRICYFYKRLPSTSPRVETFASLIVKESDQPIDRLCFLNLIFPYKMTQSG